MEPYTFVLTYEHEPDTDWSMRVQGTVQANTLDRAMVLAARSLGGRLAEVCGGCRRGWSVLIIPEGGGSPIAVSECPECGGSGCEDCGERGFMWPEPEPRKCPACNGNGLVVGWNESAQSHTIKTCPECGGNGKA